jgi:RNA polymerase sigma-70 factor (ECF subfamily)
MKATGEGVMAALGVGASGDAGGSTAAFDAFYLQHHPRLSAVLLRVTGDRARTEELVSDVFTGLYRDRERLLARPEAEVGAWLYRRAINLGIDALRMAARREKYERSAAAGEGDPSATPLDEALREADRARVRAVLASIKPASAQLLLLRASGCSYAELASVFRVEVGAIGTMLVRAQAAFRKAFQTQYPQERP